MFPTMVDMTATVWSCVSYSNNKQNKITYTDGNVLGCCKCPVEYEAHERRVEPILWRELG